MMRKAELLVFPPQHETLLSGNRPTHSVQEIVTGLLSLVGEENNREERTDIEVQPIVPASQSPATIKNYSALYAGDNKRRTGRKSRVGSKRPKQPYQAVRVFIG